MAHIVIPAVAPGNFEAVRALAHAHGDSYALGIHPMCTTGASDTDLQRLDAALHAARDDPRLVAVGEIGLDYFVPGLDDAAQRHFFRAQLALARRHGLPVLLHVRRSVDAVLAQLRAAAGGKAGAAGAWRGIAHAFNGSLQQASALAALGLKLGFGGTVTYERAQQVRRAATGVEADAIVMETDAPDIPPHWAYRSAAERADGSPQARNEPGELPAIGAALAGLRGTDAAALATATSANACAALPKLRALLEPAA